MAITDRYITDAGGGDGTALGNAWSLSDAITAINAGLGAGAFRFLICGDITLTGDMPAFTAKPTAPDVWIFAGRDLDTGTTPTTVTIDADSNEIVFKATNQLIRCYWRYIDVTNTAGPSAAWDMADGSEYHAWYRCNATNCGGPGWKFHTTPPRYVDWSYCHASFCTIGIDLPEI